MSDKKTRLKAEFYAKCQEKRYTDMSDATQSLKAKVIATDLGLKYRKIEDLYAEAERCAQIVAHEDEEARIAAEKKAEEERILADKRAVPGELILELVDSETGSSGSSVQIYRRPDGTIYCQRPPLKEKIEGAPSIEIHSSSATVYTYTPSQTFYTSATVGGVTTGGVSTIEGGYTPNTSKSGKGYLTLTLGITSFTIMRCLVPEHVCKAFKRDSTMKYYESHGEIALFRKSAMADTYRSAMFASGSDAFHTMSALSLAVDEERLSLSSCSQILDLMARIINGPWPPTDQELFDEACAQSESKDLKIVETALQTLKTLADSSDLPKETVSKKCDQVQARYDEMLQAKKEAAILEKEENAKKMKKFLLIALPAAAVLLAVVIILTTTVIPGNRYAKAQAMLDAGQYGEAIAAFEQLGDYKDSQKQIVEAQTAILEAEKRKQEAALEAKHAAAYEAAQALMDARDYYAAIAAFKALGGYRDSAERAEEAKAANLAAMYEKTETLLKMRGLYGAYTTLYPDQDSHDIWQRCFDAWGLITQRSTITAGSNNSVAVCSNGSVIATGENKNAQCNVSGWSDIVEVSAGPSFSVGLRENGTVVATGYNFSGRCDVSDWSEIVAISAGGSMTVGLRADGTVVATGSNKSGQCDVSDWFDIIAISAGESVTVGLRADGTVITTSQNYSTNSWSGIAAITAGDNVVAGLQADGTVVISDAGNNPLVHYDVSDWSDIVAISAGDSFVIGLRADGTVVATGWNGSGESDVSGWSDIVAISAGDGHTLGLRADGTVVATGYNGNGECKVSGWSGIKIP